MTNFCLPIMRKFNKVPYTNKTSYNLSSSAHKTTTVYTAEQLAHELTEIQNGLDKLYYSITI